MPGPPAPFAAQGSSSLTSRHGPRRLGLPRATPRNRVPSGTAEVVRQPPASRSEHRESDRSVKPSIPHSRMYLSWPLSPPTPTFTALPHQTYSLDAIEVPWSRLPKVNTRLSTKEISGWGPRRVGYFISGSSRLSGELGEYAVEEERVFELPRSPSRQPL